ncbi:LuxR family transcriptional regulator [Paenibacillus sp. FSL R7-0273]|uniref:response regulator transcription factor n=1 Tax=Paenibacillus sp. FSL R7-0273 TaxID=1536772 RepID=UPI0004F642BD|nr:response regulator transcription factor [Paenibacillus sp. FSL R7-0273]AIQ49269.1 LuxR family transcriptional regulator [Paenibacillus sp. FSL R7-0273]OMF87160.1 DNA-binding response regulator [Paenibacillus sp. FSL R7-0273]
MGKIIRVVIADDQPFVRQGLRYIIDAQPDMECAGEAEDGEAACRLAADTKPDIILMDIQMPVLSGIEATQRILSENAEIRIVLLTTFDVEAYVIEGIRAGAAGYLLKDTEMQDILDGIRWADQGNAIYRTPTASKALARAIADYGKRIGLAQPSGHLGEELTERELDVLQQMAYGRNNAEIAGMLNISQGTVKTHIHRILQKLEVEDRTKAVVLAIRTGLVE